MATRPAPTVSPDTEFFWTATEEKETPATVAHRSARPGVVNLQGDR